MLRAFILLTTLLFGPGLLALSTRAVLAGWDTWWGVANLLVWGAINTVAFVVVWADR